MHSTHNYIVTYSIQNSKYSGNLPALLGALQGVRNDMTQH